MRLDALEEEVARLLKEGVDGDVQGIDGRVQRGLDGVPLEIGERVGLLDLVLGGRRGDLMEERREQVRVVDGNWELCDDVSERKLRLLEAVTM